MAGTRLAPEDERQHASAHPAPPVRGSVTAVQGTALYIGAVLGTGVLTLPGYAARLAGPASLVAWVGMVALSIPLAITFAALGSRLPDSGGVSTYVRQAFGRRPAAVVGWWFYIGAPVGVPALAIFGGSYLSALIHGNQDATALYAALLLGIGLFSNAFGVRVSGRVQLFLSGGLALMLVVAVLVAAPHARLDTMQPFAPHGWSAVGSAAALLVWCFTGWETMTHLAGEFARPERDIKRATTGALVLIGVLYLLLATTTVLVLGGSEEAAETPLASLLTYGFGSAGPALATLVAVLVTLGTINAYVGSTAKLGAALARDGALPRYLAPGAETGGVPRRSLFVVSLVSGAALALATRAGVGVEVLMLGCTACLIAVYVVGTAAGIRLLRDGGGGARLMAGLALVMLICVLGLTGWFLLWPAFLAVVAAVFTHFHRNREA
ncbi:amino acid permease [Streptomyces sp. CB03238]|uniref:APC family permease n=1 Tax=Streptomyces sp. CB03238 TaxID=1907777 RepID=UPI000A0F5AFC|nr:amino acid permease [Streptomyces sp. CB03238]ORT57366.1 amino acid permease [Streptomyces sp. CB03238]